jgi:membrane protease subunit (stomatin/prohibitin family)
MNILFKKLATYLLILSMMGVPLVSAFGQSFSCNKSDVATAIEAQQNTMAADHNCCEKPEKVLCMHCGECDCDHAQGSFNLITLESNNLTLPHSSSFGTVSYTFQLLDSLTSLYRPPRIFL